MPKASTAFLLMLLATGTQASGPYSPTRVDPKRDEVYNAGKALFFGDTKLGNGNSCAECHTKKDALNRARLERIKYNLQTRINECVRTPERVNGAIEEKQMEALVHYLAKRYGL
jgi:mono/diheme cytochrome c family protein